jgi:hypothetical protein
MFIMKFTTLAKEPTSAWRSCGLDYRGLLWLGLQQSAQAYQYG